MNKINEQEPLLSSLHGQDYVEQKKDREAKTKLEQLDVAFHNISLTVPITVDANVDRNDEESAGPQRRHGHFLSKIWHKKVVKQKRILNNISGTFKAGRMVAIMGKSGSGKSSLLNTLAGEIYIKDSDIEGRLQMNGRDCSAAEIRAHAGYVYQEDLIMETMTVREAVTMSAKLRLPAQNGNESMSSQHQQVVDDIIEILDLEKSQNTLISSVSGGEKKRTALAMELIVNPQILFLDEPVSGLDAYTAYNVMSILKQLSLKRTIITTIHQPNSDIFQLFDDLLLLDQGQVIYNGPVVDVVTYFKKLGYECPQYTNPADFLFMHVLNDRQVGGTAVTTFGAAVECIEYLTSNWQQHSQINHPDDDDAATLNGNKYHNGQYEGEITSSFQTQMLVLLKRAFFNILRNPLLFKVKIVQALFVSLLLGSIYWRVDTRTLSQQLQDRPGALFFVTVNMIMMYAFGILTVFSGEKRVFTRELQSRYYSLPAYFLSKTVVELPFQILFPVFQALLIYLAVFWDSFQFTKLLTFACTLILLANCGQAIGVFSAAAFNDLNVALAIVPLVLMPAMTFAGLFINSKSVPVYFIWGPWVSPLRYGFNAAMRNEYAGWTYRDGDGNVLMTGDQALQNLGLDDQLSIAWDLIILLGIYVTLIGLSYFALWRAVKR